MGDKVLRGLASGLLVTQLTLSLVASVFILVIAHSEIGAALFLILIWSGPHAVVAALGLIGIGMTFQGQANTRGRGIRIIVRIGLVLQIFYHLYLAGQFMNDRSYYSPGPWFSLFLAFISVLMVLAFQGFCSSLHAKPATVAGKPLSTSKQLDAANSTGLEDTNLRGDWDERKPGGPGHA